MKNTKRQPAPASLSPESKRLWRKLIEEYEVEDNAGFALLFLALRALDESTTLEAHIAKTGFLVPDRFGILKQNPATLCLRDSRNTFMRALKQLGLDISTAPPLK